MQTVATLPLNPFQTDAGHDFTIQEFLNVFHSDLSGHIHYAYADPTQPVSKQWVQKAYTNLEEFGQQISFNHSEYMTFNTTVYKSRKVKFLSKYNRRMVYNVHELNAFVIDIDIYSEKAKFRNNAQGFFDRLDSLVEYGILPQYSFLVNSGNGFYVIWQIEKIRLSRRKDMKKKVAETLAIYEAIQRYLVSLFKDFGSDGQCIDPTHVFGLPGSYNCKGKVKKRRYIMKFNEDAVTTMSEFRQEYLPKEIDDSIYKKFYPDFDNKKNKKKISNKTFTKKTQKKEKRTLRKSATPRFNTFDKHNLIIADLEKLMQLRKGQSMVGYRSLISLMIRYSYGILKNDEIAVQEMLRLNSQFGEPMDEGVLIDKTKYAVQAVADFKIGKVVEHDNKLVRAGYNYSKRRMIELLEISKEEQELLKYLVDPTVTYERKKEKKKERIRDEFGLTSRDKQTLDTYTKVQQLKTEGMSQSQVAELTGVNVRTVKRNWMMPSGKNSESIYAVYAESMAALDEEKPAEKTSKRGLSAGDTKSSCYVVKGVSSSLGRSPERLRNSPRSSDASSSA